MNSAVAIHRLHFAFTVTFHDIFPQLTMGLALLIVVLKSLALLKHDELYNNAARFLTAIQRIDSLTASLHEEMGRDCFV